MVQILRISEETSLEGLEKDFLLKRNDQLSFFLEWQQDLPNLTPSDRLALNSPPSGSDHCPLT
jgi:hypothetical protein